MPSIIEHLPEDLQSLVTAASNAVKAANNILAISHIDADGITALAIIVKSLQRLGKQHVWRNIHQLNSDTILEVKDLVREHQPDLVIFSDLGTGQMHLIQEHLVNDESLSVENIVVLDHHIPDEERGTSIELVDSGIIEINPWHHEMSGSYGLSGAGAAFILAYEMSAANVDLTELAIVGATGDLQDYYGRGFTGLNERIVELGIESGHIKIEKDLTFFGINTRPLPYLLQYATDPYLPGITGVEDACFTFLNDLGVQLKVNDNWRMWVDLNNEEKQKIVQGLIRIILETYENPSVASGIIGDVVTLAKRPAKTVLRSAKEFSTLLNACGRNRRADIGVQICLGVPDAYETGRILLQQHRQNLAMALRRLESENYAEMPGMYVVNDPQTPDTIIGIVIGMAQGSRIIPIDKPVIGVATNTVDDGPMIKISGRAHKSVVEKGVSLRDVFTSVSETLNEQHGRLMAEGGGHPMAAGCFVHETCLDDFLQQTSDEISSILFS